MYLCYASNGYEDISEPFWEVWKNGEFWDMVLGARTAQEAAEWFDLRLVCQPDEWPAPPHTEVWEVEPNC